MRRLHASGVALLAVLATVGMPRLCAAQEATPVPSAEPDRAPAQDQDAAARLQAAAANPLASLISVPFQFNASTGIGPYHQFGYSMNVQPVVPLPVGATTTMIFRTIVPLTYVPELNKNPLVGNVFGLGPVNPQFYFVPKKGGAFTFGPGVTFLLPTSTNPLVGPNKWAAGPDVAVVAQSAHALYGFIANNLWSFAGSPQGQNINSFFVQPFYTRNFAHGVGLGATSQITANWEAPAGQRWTVPIFLNISQLQKAGGQPLSVVGGIGWYAVRPQGTATWFVRYQVTLLYPTAAAKEAAAQK
ncbi:MAG: neuromedin U [Candidatus Baltobacteraceae bacterium]